MGDAAGLPENIGWTLQLLPARLATSEKVRFHVVIRNTDPSSQTVEFGGSSRPLVDFRVSDVSGTVLWQLIGNNPTVASTIGFSIAAGDSFVIDEEWNQRLNSGQLLTSGCYLVEAFLFAFSGTGSNRLRSPLTPLQVIGGAK
jgi:hypothetical protein